MAGGMGPEQAFPGSSQPVCFLAVWWNPVRSTAVSHNGSQWRGEQSSGRRRSQTRFSKTAAESLMASSVSMIRSGRHRSRSSIRITNDLMSVSLISLSKSFRNFLTSKRSGFPDWAFMRSDHLISSSFLFSLSSSPRWLSSFRSSPGFSVPVEPRDVIQVSPC